MCALAAKGLHRRGFAESVQVDKGHDEHSQHYSTSRVVQPKEDAPSCAWREHSHSPSIAEGVAHYAFGSRPAETYWSARYHVRRSPQWAVAARRTSTRAQSCLMSKAIRPELAVLGHEARLGI